MASKFLAELADAVAAQTGLAKDAPVNAQGELCAIGAYGYAKDKKVRDAVLLLRNRRSLSPKDRQDLSALACERSITVAYENADSLTIRSVYYYNDGKDQFVGEDVPSSETPSQRRDRVLNSVRRGYLPGLMRDDKDES